MSSAFAAAFGLPLAPPATAFADAFGLPLAPPATAFAAAFGLPLAPALALGDALVLAAALALSAGSTFSSELGLRLRLLAFATFVLFSGWSLGGVGRGRPGRTAASLGSWL